MVGGQQPRRESDGTRTNVAVTFGNNTINRSFCTTYESDDMDDEEKREYIRKHIKTYPDFPKKGILNREIFSALNDSKACLYIKELLLNHIKEEHPEVELFVGLESRGFLFIMMLATELGIGCAPIRKKGKLPGECWCIEYDLEYGTDCFEIQKCAVQPGQKVIIVDDVLATGGSLKAAVDLLNNTDCDILEGLVMIELEHLCAREKVGCNVHSLILYP